VFQAGAILCAADPGAHVPDDAVPVLTKIADARFKHMVHPGETLRIEVDLTERVGAARFMSGRITSAGRTVLRVEFVVTLAPVHKDHDGG
jgi:3-hydroxyacyl-[acyl-carrier-protein] dehydratase